MMHQFFDLYQQKLTAKEKLNFLRNIPDEICNDNAALLIVNALIILESTNESGVRLDTVGTSYDLPLKNVADQSPWWSLLEGIVYLKHGKYNLTNCEHAIESLGQYYKMTNDESSFYLFYCGHAYYEIGKLTDDENTSYIALKKSMVCFSKIYNNYLDDKPDRYKATVLNALGNVEFKIQNRTNNKDFETAKQNYKKALIYDEGFSFAYNGLGNIYREKFKYGKAIQMYSRAANAPDFMWPWNYLGDCFRHLEKYKLAMKCYERAIAICKRVDDPMFVVPLYGIGRIYYELGNRNNSNELYYKKSIEIFLEIKDQFSSCPPQIRHTLKDLAQAYQKICCYDKAISVYQLILDCNLFSMQPNYVELVNDGIKKCNEHITMSNLCALNQDDPAKEVMCKIIQKGYAKRVADKKDSFDVNFLRRKKIPSGDYSNVISRCKDNKDLSAYIQETQDEASCDELVILRRWNSYTPLITNSKGGGYFVRIDGYGIVIDPGHDFIKNFKEAGYCFADIDIILISHAHDDHTADLEAIINMQYRFNKALRETVLRRDFAKERKISTSEIDDDENFRKIVDERYEASKKRIVFYTSSGVYRKYKGMLDSMDNFQHHEDQSVLENLLKSKKEIHLTEMSFDDCVRITDSVSIRAIRAFHKDLISECESLGFVIETTNTALVYTGDTAWCSSCNETLQEQYNSLYQQYKYNKRIVLLAHLGGFKDYENNYLIPLNITSRVYYDNHLGRLGLAKLIESLKPDICLISEFGEEFNGIRIELSQIFTNVFCQTVCLPTDIGLHLILPVDITSPKIRIKAISRLDPKNNIIEYENICPEDIGVGEYRYNNSLFYYKKDAGFSQNDCIRALIDNYSYDNKSKDFLKLEF